jgi:hypothetical protein
VSFAKELISGMAINIQWLIVLLTGEISGVVNTVTIAPVKNKFEFNV